MSINTSKIRSYITFIKQGLKSPRKTGTLMPSLATLGRTMAKKVPAGDGLVIELGAGTGAITQQLINYIDPKRLLVIELVPWMVKELQEKFPKINIIQGDASELSKYIPIDKKVDCIVSSLPFFCLNSKIRTNIIAEMKKVLQGAPLIQFAYLPWKVYLSKKRGFHCLSKSTVWKNMPPARVFELIPIPN